MKDQCRNKNSLDILHFQSLLYILIEKLDIIIDFIIFIYNILTREEEKIRERMRTLTKQWI